MGSSLWVSLVPDNGRCNMLTLPDRAAEAKSRTTLLRDRVWGTVFTLAYLDLTVLSVLLLCFLWRCLGLKSMC